MTTYKYTDESNTVVAVYDEDDISRISGLASALVPEGTTVEPYVEPLSNLNTPILAKIAELESKWLRPFRDGEVDKANAIRDEISELRKTLQ